MEHKALSVIRKNGKEEIVLPTGEKIATLDDFWSWAYSDLLQNAERGVLAEFLVAKALGIENHERISWDKYDLKSDEGISIEIKSSGYFQTWKQDKASNIVFGIQPTRGWDNITNTHDTVIKRQSDIYVFCVHNFGNEEDEKGGFKWNAKDANPLDLSQWDFYLLPTAILDEKVGRQKTITLKRLQNIGAQRCPYENLHEQIVELILGGKT